MEHPPLEDSIISISGSDIFLGKRKTLTSQRTTKTDHSSQITDNSLGVSGTERTAIYSFFDGASVEQSKSNLKNWVLVSAIIFAHALPRRGNIFIAPGFNPG